MRGRVLPRDSTQNSLNAFPNSSVCLFLAVIHPMTQFSRYIAFIASVLKCSAKDGISSIAFIAAQGVILHVILRELDTFFLNKKNHILIHKCKLIITHFLHIKVIRIFIIRFLCFEKNAGATLIQQRKIPCTWLPAIRTPQQIGRAHV